MTRLKQPEREVLEPWSTPEWRGPGPTRWPGRSSWSASTPRSGWASCARRCRGRRPARRGPGALKRAGRSARAASGQSRPGVRLPHTPTQRGRLRERVHVRAIDEEVSVGAVGLRLAPPRGSKILEPQPWSTTTTPGRGWSLTDAASSISPTGENTRTRSPSLTPRAAASSGWMTTLFRLPDGMQAGQLVEPRVHRVPVAPVGQLEG